MIDAEEKCTHLVSINIWNEESSYSAWYERAEQLYSDDPDDATIDLAKELADYYRDEGNPLAEHRLVYSDLLGFALACVDWHKIAGDFISTVKENQ